MLTFETGGNAEAGVKKYRHYLHPVGIGTIYKMFQVVEELFRVVMVY